MVSVSGRVIDYLTRQPMPGATVTFGSGAATADATGLYSVSVTVGTHTVTVPNAMPVTMNITSAHVRGDVFANTPAECVARYGVITDAHSHEPLAGATVHLTGLPVTGPDGWYVADYGCIGSAGFNTTFMTVTAPGHEQDSSLLGRGIQRVVRRDVVLKPTCVICP